MRAGRFPHWRSSRLGSPVWVGLHHPTGGWVGTERRPGYLSMFEGKLKPAGRSGELRDYVNHWFIHEQFSDWEEERHMTPLLGHDPSNTTPDEGPAVARITAAQAHELVAAGRGGLGGTRDARLFGNAHARGAPSGPLSTIQAPPGQGPASLP